MHVITRRGFPTGVLGNVLNSSVAQDGSEGKRLRPPRVGEAVRGARTARGISGSSGRSCAGGQTPCKDTGESQENGAQGRSWRSKPCAQNSRKRRRVYELKSTKRSVVALEGIR